MAGEVKTQGTTLHISPEDADTVPYATATKKKVGKLRSIGEPDGEASETDTTNLDSSAKEFMSGIPDNGKIAISGFTDDDDDGQGEMMGAKDAQERRWITITRSDGAARWFKAAVTKFADFSAEPDGVVPFNGTLRVSGSITRVPAP